MEAKKGHWTKGKRRNPDRGDWGAIRVALTALIDNHFQPGVVSASALAEAVNVYTRTVTRWLNGTNRPPPEMQDKVATWIALREEEIRQKRKRK